MIRVDAFAQAGVPVAAVKGEFADEEVRDGVEHDESRAGEGGSRGVFVEIPPLAFAVEFEIRDVRGAELLIALLHLGARLPLGDLPFVKLHEDAFPERFARGEPVDILITRGEGDAFGGLIRRFVEELVLRVESGESHEGDDLTQTRDEKGRLDLLPKADELSVPVLRDVFVLFGFLWAFDEYAPFGALVFLRSNGSVLRRGAPFLV